VLLIPFNLEYPAMNPHMMSRYSIIQSAKRFLPVVYLVIAIGASSLMPLAVPIAWAELQDDTRVWGNVTARGNFGYIDPDFKRWLWWMEGQLRARDCCSSDIALDQSLIRPGLGYALTDQSTVWMGYARVENYINDQEVAEDRMWEQYMWKGSTPLGAFSLRTRFEQRWLANGNDVGQRFRQFVKFHWPFSFFPAANFTVWDEVFVNMNSTDWGTEQGFDQNRGFVGIGYRYSPEILTEIGYMNQFIQTSRNDRMNHILSVSVFFDFYKN
jgi:Protein of unknown function (DUF2490)